MFSLRRKPSQEPASAIKDAGKGRPTPTRKEAEAANKRPLVPTDRREAARMTREQRDRARERMNHALQTGEERYLPARDKGPVRRWTRDWIDSRTSIAEYFLFAAIAMVVGVFALERQPIASVFMVLVMYVVTLAFAIDAMVRGVRLRRALNARFGAQEVPRGTVWYGVSRSIQMRRTRLPKPQVARRQYPE
ncbi:MAG: DUF3043 domain-containing protein [Bifidobacteriaceae bacterium]|nr:DUF3043 domain-containing protein [Bifidobacteriaceae bacterium]